MPFPSRWTSLAWLLAPLGGVALCLLFAQARLERLTALEARVTPVALPAPIDALGEPSAPPGTQLTLGSHPESLEWMQQTQQARTLGAWRVREVDYDNAPNGRVTHRAAPYRWWLQTWAAGFGTAADGDAAAVEAAARWADPLLQSLTLLIGAVIVAWRWGRRAGALTGVMLALLYPWAGNFVAAHPSEIGLGLALTGLSGLLLMAGLGTSGAGRPVRWFAAAGALAGIAVWVNPGLGVPWVLATAAGAGLAGIMHRRRSGSSPAAVAWRVWAVAGAGAVIGGWAIEYLPAATDWRELRAVHPAYAVAWLGLGDLLQRLWHRRLGRVGWLPGAAALAVLPGLLVGLGQSGFLSATSTMSQLTRLPGGLAAENLLAGWAAPGGPVRLLAGMLPLLVLVPAIRQLRQEHGGAGAQTARWFSLGLTAVLVGWATVRLQWWAWVNLGALLVWLACVGGRESGILARRRWSVGSVLVLLPGLMGLMPAPGPGAATATEPGNRALAERDLARFLARRVGNDPAVVLAPPATTMALIRHGGLRGLGTPFWENLDGFRVSTRLAGTNSQDEALALVEQRRLTHIVMPSWDTFLEDYARLGATDLESSLVALLQSWHPPRWLRAVPYELPAGAGLTGEAAIVFEVVEVQDDPTALSRLAEYFVLMGDLRRAVAVAQALQASFGSDPGGLVAQAQVAVAINNPGVFRQAMEALVQLLREGRDRGLLWDQRVTLTLLLERGELAEFLEPQLRQTVATADERDLRQLPRSKLIDWRRLLRARGLDLPDAPLAALADALAASR